MRALGRWMLVGLAAAVATVAAIGYALIATDAVPAGRDLGVLDVPDGSSARGVHEPSEGEVFAPSVAAAEEPPGWIWLEGRLLAVGGQAVLCDGGGADCVTGAVVRGTDPARVDLEAGIPHLFLGRVRDGAIEELFSVPSMEGGG